MVGLSTARRKAVHEVGAASGGASVVVGEVKDDDSCGRQSTEWVWWQLWLGR